MRSTWSTSQYPAAQSELDMEPTKFEPLLPCWIRLEARSIAVPAIVLTHKISTGTSHRLDRLSRTTVFGNRDDRQVADESESWQRSLSLWQPLLSPVR